MTAIIGARITEFQRKMATVRKTMMKTPSELMIKVKARVNKAQVRLDRLAQTLNTIQTLGASFGLGSFMAISPAAIPVLAATAGGLGAVVSYFGMAGAAAVAFGGVAIPIISKLFDETTKLNSAQKVAKGSFSALQETWRGITKELEKPVLEAFTKAMQGANKVLQMSKPLFTGATQAVNNLLASMNKSLDSSPVKAFFDYMNKQGGPMLETMGKTLGNFLQGLMSMMVAFGPLSQSFSQGFLKMSESFAVWASKLGESEKFKSFIAYVQENGPKVLTLIGNLTNFLINLGVGMAPLGTQILDLVNKFLSWSNAMMQANPGLAQAIGYGIVAMGVLKALAAPVVMLTSLFSGFGAKTLSIFKKLTPVFNAMKLNFVVGMKLIGQNVLKMSGFFVRALSTVIQWILRLSGPIGWAISAVILLATIVISNWDKIKSWTIKTWSAVSKTLSETWNKIKNVIRVGATESYRIIQEKLNQALSFVKGLGSSFLAAGKGLIDMMAKGISSAAGKVLSSVKSIAQKVRNFLPFSPAKVGPLSDLDKLDFGGPIRDSISRARSIVQREMTNLLQPQRTEFAYDTGLSGSDFGRIRHDIGAEVSNFERESRPLEVPVILNGEEIARASIKDINRINTGQSRLTDGFGGK